LQGNALSEQITNYFEQGVVQLEDGNFRVAVNLFTKAIRLTLGDLAEIHVYRGVAWAHLDEWANAYDDFNEALYRNPYMTEAYNERGNLYRFQNNYEAAIQDFTAAIMIDPTHAEAYYNRGLTYEETKEYRLAEQDLSNTIELNPTLAVAYEARARIRRIVGNYQGTIADYQIYLAIGGGHQYDNHSEIQSLVFLLRIEYLIRRLFRLER
jgi:tetratricopeptide (TPR) repeat protein